jgi:hypothetical protein
MNENEGQEEAIGHLLLSLSVVGRLSSLMEYFLDTASAESPASRRNLRVGYGGYVNGREQ